MSKEFVLVSMIFLHIVDDYYLQGILASMKQKKWWEQNAPNLLYKNDYKIALAMHSLSWAFMIMLPIALYAGFNIGTGFTNLLFANALIHGIVDDLKANKYKINLIKDQLVHIIQIWITFIICILVH